MIYSITYQRNNAQHTHKWVVESGWTERAVIADFERRFYGARVLSLEPTEVTA